MQLPWRAEVPAVAGPAPDSGEHAPSPLRVAVVEDNDDGRATLVDLLELQGHDVRAAADGGSGLDLVRRFRPDAVLLDLGLPVLDGLEVCRRLRADPALRTTRLVALTGRGTEHDRVQTEQAGFDEHLTKPIEPETLRRTLARVAGR